MVNAQQSPGKGFQDLKVPNQQQLNAMRQQLSEVMGEVLEHLDQTTKKELHCLSNKQNDMYQLANKYNMQTQMKNEALGLWYDAKTKVTSLMGDLKNLI